MCIGWYWLKSRCVSLSEMYHYTLALRHDNHKSRQHFKCSIILLCGTTSHGIRLLVDKYLVQSNQSWRRVFSLTTRLLDLFWWVWKHSWSGTITLILQKSHIPRDSLSMASRVGLHFIPPWNDHLSQVYCIFTDIFCSPLSVQIGLICIIFLFSFFKSQWKLHNWKPHYLNFPVLRTNTSSHQSKPFTKKRNSNKYKQSPI